MLRFTLELEIKLLNPLKYTKNYRIPVASIYVCNVSSHENLRLLCGPNSEESTCVPIPKCFSAALDAKADIWT